MAATANPVGEDSWLAYLEETARNASDLEQRVNVVELYERAVGAEPGSLRLWLAYCDYFWGLWIASRSADAGWSEEEQAMGQELFSFDAALDLWQKGYNAVKYRLDDSHEFWNRWISFEMDQFTKTKTPEGLQRITQLYRDRLSTPHLAWDDTSQAFSSFLSEHNQPSWEQTMKEVTSGAQDIKKAVDFRDSFELKLKKALREGDTEGYKTLFRDYLDWEVRASKRKTDNPELAFSLCSGLFDRALSSTFATDDDAWYEYITFLSSNLGSGSSIDKLYDALRRAVQHCPWSGRLWNRYILCADEARLPFSEVEAIKHAAMGDDQLYKDGMESMIEMYVAWCGYLKRMAQSDPTGEAVDVADVGLKAALEDVQVAGKRLYGKQFQGDPKIRLEQIYIQYLTDKKSDIDGARAQWKKLEKVRVNADSHEFWLRYYTWEMLVFSSASSTDDGSLRAPTAATAVLEVAATRKSLDWPEKILEVYLQHCRDYELPSTIRQATDLVHTTGKAVRYRRQKEEEQKAAAYAAYYETQAAAEPVAASAPAEGASPSGAKRKRESLLENQDDDEESASKRQRNGQDKPADATTAEAPKRDRENATILVTNLPGDATQTKVRQYFKEYGHINNITAFVKDERNHSTTALIEFSSTEEAQSALLRDAKYFGQSQLSVQPGYDLTVYVANYPPAADETFMRKLFKDCGEILSIRWPSLKVNTHRRFCYISFADREASAKAVAKEGSLLEGKYKLLAKYSDPGRKKNREGAIAEAREVHVSNLDRSATKEEVEAVFAKFGKVTRINIPQNMAGHNRGFAFLDFETKEQAAKAADELNNTKFHSQILQVEVSKENKVKPSAKLTDFQRDSASPSAHSRDNEGDEAMGDAGGSSKPSASEISARTIALTGLPDTVNDARVRALVEPIGSIVKLVHQPGHGRAIIEFADAATAGKAGLQLDGMDFDGHKLSAGSPDDQGKQNNSKSSTASGSGGMMAPPSMIRRPAPGGRPKRGLGFAPRKAAPPSDGASGAAGQAKSNADFKAMFLAGKKGDASGGDAGDKAA